MLSSAVARVVLLVAVFVALAALAHGDAGDHRLQQLDLPADRSPYFANYGTGAGAGDDLVLLQQLHMPGANSNSTVLRRDDGTWWMLPPLPFAGFIQLASAADRVVAGGFACTDVECKGDRRLAFAMLRQDHSAWDRLDGPSRVFGPFEEPELTTGPGVSGVARFEAGGITYVVDPTGTVARWKRSPLPGAEPTRLEGPREVACIVDDLFMSVLAAVPDGAGDFFPPDELIGEIHLWSVGGGSEWRTAGPVPPGVLTRSVVCGAGVVSFVDGEVSTNYDVRTGAWSTTPSNVTEMPMWISPISGRFAIASDRAAVFAQGRSGTILRRVGTGPWEEIGVRGHVFATGTGVLVIGDDRSVTQVWPR